MTIRLDALGVRAIVLDIEGTTTPIAFVHDVLFPFARERLASWLADDRHAAERQAIVPALLAEHAADAEHPGPFVSPADYARWLMDRDRKSPALKELQGLIWEDGYRAGHLRGVVFDDVPEAMARWTRQGIAIAIYSSGSELAQRRLFQSLPQGDLSREIAHFFDTRVGPKKYAASYRAIAAACGLEPSRMLFVSDIVDELAAASAAGLHTVLSVRPGNAPVPAAAPFPQVTSFAELV